MGKVKINKPKIIIDDRINFIAITKILWEGKKSIFRFALIFSIIGVLVALFTRNEYKSTTIFIPQTNGVNIGGSLGGLAAMAGVNLGALDAEDGIPPTLYPEIFNSYKFKRTLTDKKLHFKGGVNAVSFYDYYKYQYNPSVIEVIKKYTVSLPGFLLSKIKSYTKGEEVNEYKTQFLKPSKEGLKILSRLEEQLLLEVDEEYGKITISASMPDPLASTSLVSHAKEVLQDFIIDFKIQKSKDKLKFIEARYFEKEEWFKKTEAKLAVYQDQNKYNKSAVAQTKLKALENEYELAFGLYNELAKQWENAQIQVTEDTPVFTILQEPVIPVEKDKPKRILLILSFAILGGLIGAASLFLKDVFFLLVEQWNKN